MVDFPDGQATASAVVAEAAAFSLDRLETMGWE
jgi:hypothetical protein